MQGDIESVAAKSPKELTTLFEHISGSEAFRADYNKLAAAKEVRGLHFCNRKFRVRRSPVAQGQW